jgi:hypothetical protein
MMDDDVGSYARGKTGDFYRPGRACRMLGASPRSKKRDEGGGRPWQAAGHRPAEGAGVWRAQRLSFAIGCHKVGQVVDSKACCL